MAEPPAAFQGELRPYQKVGLGWLAKTRELGLGAAHQRQQLDRSFQRCNLQRLIARRRCFDAAKVKLHHAVIRELPRRTIERARRFGQAARETRQDRSGCAGRRRIRVIPARCFSRLVRGQQ